MKGETQDTHRDDRRGAETRRGIHVDRQGETHTHTREGRTKRYPEKQREEREKEREGGREGKKYREGERGRGRKQEREKEREQDREQARA